MKKILVFIAFFAVSAYQCCNALFAQDIIVTKKSEKIEAKITDVEQDCIKYKKYNYQEGPTYTIQKADIASVIYQNGDVETFSDNGYQNKTEQKDKFRTGDFIPGYCSHISIQSRSLFNGNKSKYSGYVIGDRLDGLDDMEIENKIRTGELIFFEDSDFKDYLKKYDNMAYQKLKQGFALQVSGYVFLITGCAMTGAFSFASLLANDGNFTYTVALPVAGAGLVLAAAVGVPLFLSGIKASDKEAPALYNSHVNNTYTSSLSWRFGVVENGVGFQLRF